MLLVVDVGNTNTVFGLYASDAATQVGSIEPPRQTWRLSTSRERTADEWFALLSPLLRSAKIEIPDIDAVTIGSVVPAVTAWLKRMCRTHLAVEPVVYGTHLDLGVGLRIEHPAEAGADRVANSLAVATHFGGPAIVVDFGTATTFDVVSADGDYLGGAITPGPMVALDALTSRAARLSAVELDLPECAIGTTTVKAVQSGTVLGYLALVEGMLDRLAAELGGRPRVVATGGLARTFFGGVGSPLAHFEPDLTLEGLRLLYLRNRRG